MNSCYIFKCIILLSHLNNFLERKDLSDVHLLMRIYQFSVGRAHSHNTAWWVQEIQIQYRYILNAKIKLARFRIDEIKHKNQFSRNMYKKVHECIRTYPHSQHSAKSCSSKNKSVIVINLTNYCNGGDFSFSCTLVNIFRRSWSHSSKPSHCFPKIKL